MSATAMREQTYHIYSGRGGGKKKNSRLFDRCGLCTCMYVTCVCYGTPRFRICNLAVSTAPTYVCTDTKLIYNQDGACLTRARITALYATPQEKQFP